MVRPVGAQRHQVQVLERLVASDTGVSDRAVERAGDLQPARPVLRDECRLERGEVRVSHADEATLCHRQDAAGVIAKARTASQHTAVQVQLQLMRDHVRVRVIEPRASLGANLHRQPVRSVHEALVLDDVPGELGGEPVVNAGDVGAWVMRAVSDPLGCGTTCREVPVAEGAERLALALGVGIVALVGQDPLLHALVTSKRASSTAAQSTTPATRPRTR